MLVELLRANDPDLLAARAGVITALGDHWGELDAARRESLEVAILEVYWQEKSDWLRTLLLELLANYPPPR